MVQLVFYVVHKGGTSGNDNEIFRFLNVIHIFWTSALNILPVCTAQNLGVRSLYGRHINSSSPTSARRCRSVLFVLQYFAIWLMTEGIWMINWDVNAHDSDILRTRSPSYYTYWNNWGKYRILEGREPPIRTRNYGIRSRSDKQITVALIAHKATPTATQICTILRSDSDTHCRVFLTLQSERRTPYGTGPQTFIYSLRPP
jgi:hypothetical protein